MRLRALVIYGSNGHLNRLCNCIEIDLAAERPFGPRVIKQILGLDRTLPCGALDQYAHCSALHGVSLFQCIVKGYVGCDETSFAFICFPND